MLNIISKRHRETHIEYKLEFYGKETDEVYWSFPLLNGKDSEIVPCKEGEKVNTYEPCSEEECTWWKYYLKASKDDSLYSRQEKHEWSWIEPAKGICSCGETVYLTNEYYGACECPGCGQWYNMFGQELLPPNKWEEEDDY